MRTSKAKSELKAAREKFLTTYAKQLGWDGKNFSEAALLLAGKIGRAARSIGALKRGQTHLAPEKVDALKKALGDQSEFLDPSCLLRPQASKRSPSRRRPKRADPAERAADKAVESAKAPKKGQSCEKAAAKAAKISPPSHPPNRRDKELLSFREIDGQNAIVFPNHVQVTISTVESGMVVTLRPHSP